MDAARRLQFDDAEILKFSKQVKQRMATKLEDAYDIVFGAQAHDNWKCSEKKQVDESIRTIHRNLKSLSSSMHYLANIIAMTANEFKTAESTAHNQLSGSGEGKSFWGGIADGLTDFTNKVNNFISSITGWEKSMYNPKIKKIPQSVRGL